MSGCDNFSVDIFTQQKQMEEELRQLLSHRSLRGSDEESDSEERKTLPLSPSPHPPLLTPHTLSPPQPTAHGTTGDQPSLIIQANPSDNLAGQLPNRVRGGVGRGRQTRQIHMHRGKCLGEYIAVFSS